jgi:hypothetical protein
VRQTLPGSAMSCDGECTRREADGLLSNQM